MKYYLKDENGKPIQWVNDLTITELPDGAIEMTDEEWDQRHKLTPEEEAEVAARFEAAQAERIAKREAAAAKLAALGLEPEDLTALMFN